MSKTGFVGKGWGENLGKTSGRYEIQKEDSKRWPTRVGGGKRDLFKTAGGFFSSLAQLLSGSDPSSST